MQTEARGAFGSGDITAQYKLAGFVVQQMLLKASFCAPVMVKSVTNDGGVSPIGRVSIQPLVQQLDGDRNVVDHGVIHNVPYLRIQGGANAVILDPKVGDIGIAVFCDRDISAVKATGAVAPPGSDRTNHMADAVYLNTVIGATPSQYVRFSEAGIEVVSPVKVHIQAPAGQLDIDTLDINGSALRHNGVNIGKTHTHTGVTPGSGTSGPPTT